ncbi:MULTISPECIES: flagellar filament capping protein FliD [unclassified Exiguobacterium]|uniref:flagellar filament capping protein FliD n=1 Tax=unclassified Exiguobacterium TaxID=2644629 RepID=UPI00103AB804|nr:MULTISPECIES: flagellar filament capping protein FliD [unclassified Exiguobacterium]TCI48022.1 flagellar hook-associated protein [Exiguobacterium sp. SH5S32]TCI54906.1 flagellar hook-associated protein [Exiguobacterium sp. SH1S4]TCI74702.1 flagellar hook-associated protein [Exiguobacterium sp. SH1S1]
MTSPIRFGGLASGIDTDTIIKQLMQVERAPVDKLEQKKQTTEWKRDAYREINRSLMNLRNSAVDLSFSRNFYAKTSSSSDESRVSVVAGPSSGNTAIRIESVSQLATAATQVVEPVDKNGVKVTKATKVADMNLQSATQEIKLSTATKEWTLSPKPRTGETIALKDATNNPIADTSYTYDEATGKVTMNDGSDVPTGTTATYTSGYQIQIRSVEGGDFKTIKVAEDATMENLVTALNGKDSGISAFFEPISGKLSLTQKQTGEKAIIEFDATTKAAFKIDPAALPQKGGDASFMVNGISMTQSSNTVTIDNMTVTLKSSFAAGNPVTLSAATDTQKIFDNIKGFVDKYNETIDLMNKKVKEDRFRSFAPLTQAQRDELSDDEIKKWEEKAMSGMLRGDTIVRSAMDSMRSKWSSTSSATNDDTMKQLFQIGLSTGADFTNGGKIELNEEKLKAAIEKDPEQVYQLFTNADSGLLPKIRDAATNSRSSITRIAGADGSGAPTYSMGREMAQIDTRIQRLNDLLVNKENAYYRRFTAMETAMNQANSQAASLQQFLGGGM